MLKVERLDEINEYIKNNVTVSLDELVKVFDVSKNTIRRDVNELVKSGEFSKIYGGVSVNRSTIIPYKDRSIQNQAAKQQIAKQAASYVEDGDIIFLDSGTTTVEMFHFIKHKKVTVITNNMEFVIAALPFENLNIFSTGGMLERKTKSLTSIHNKEVIRGYNINKAFLASSGISLKNGVTNSLPVESDLKACVVEKSDDVFLLVDHHKFDKYSLTTYCRLEQIDHLVTDKQPANQYLDFMKKHNIKLMVTGK
ncbi:DeoR/GlpR family DNA-binding transcription regulator [Oceanobacillus sp. Castelsardo]|uniref:DeoR/GlpR family DNA-binding transcription regulator n=1 Tax=Oceanobacillus sp. Castelsardo TaxID=1851204 RepID=UPI000837F974|nr:DeoR/GlpR family DNA-binding transcription regulator [Oceanobacillus sp. Castelsardo]